MGADANISAIASSSAAVGGAVSSAGNAYAQASATKAQGEYQSRMMELNAKMAEFNAQYAIKRGDTQAKAAVKAGQRVIGSQRAALAASGVDVESGSAMDVQENTAALAAEDAMVIKNNAWLEAWGYKTQASSARSQAAFTSMAAGNEARNTLLAGGINGINVGLKYMSDYYSKKPMTPTETPRPIAGYGTDTTNPYGASTNSIGNAYPVINRSSAKKSWEL
jgi:hypothetical protein